MELQKTKHEIKLARWGELVLECRSSGMHVKDWCKEHNICIGTYYRWQRQVWDESINHSDLSCRPASPVTFSEYVQPSQLQHSSPAVVLHLSCGKMEIQNGAEQAVIESTLQALSKLC